MRKVLYSQKRYFLPQMTPPTQSELNQFRSTQQEGFEWIADAMWKDGRMATMKEMLERDPMNYELMVDKQMRKREHPLHHGIKAAFEKRLQYLKQQESKGDLPSGYEYKAGLEVPIGLTASQERVFLEMAAHNDEINKSFSGGGNKSRPPTYEEQYDNELNEYGVTRAQIKELYVIFLLFFFFLYSKYC